MICEYEGIDRDFNVVECLRHLLGKSLDLLNIAYEDIWDDEGDEEDYDL